MGENDKRAVLVIHPAVVGRGHCHCTAAAKVRANRVSDIGWKEVSNFLPIGPTHCHDDRAAGLVADAVGTSSGIEKELIRRTTA